MFKILGILLLGAIIGRFLRGFSKVQTTINKLVMLVIYLLLFLLGVSIGKNNMILNNLTTLGVQALLLTIGGILGSIILAKIVFIKYFNKSYKDEG
jgi:uncharacterized membrane protein YbjE (DUF340 family)